MPVETPDAGKRPPLLLLLHGYGSNEADLFGLAPYTDRRFLVVSARAPYVLDAGSYAWFNLTFTERGIVSDMEEAERSLARLSQFVGELGEAYEFDAGRVYLMGFSQGAMLALGAALTEPERVAGVVAMSGRLSAGALEGKMAAPEALEGLPVFITHGTYDPMIPVEGARQTREALSKLPIALTYREYPMAHEVSLESLRDISAWLVARLDEDRRGSSSDVRDV
jgi:phospholipase/carboxylesterase